MKEGRMAEEKKRKGRVNQQRSRARRQATERKKETVPLSFVSQPPLLFFLDLFFYFFLSPPPPDSTLFQTFYCFITASLNLLMYGVVALTTKVARLRHLASNT